MGFNYRMYTEGLEFEIESTCCCCGEVHLCLWIEDPFEADINGVEIRGWWCESCYQQACASV